MFDIIRKSPNSHDFFVVKTYTLPEGLVMSPCGILRVMGKKYDTSYVAFNVADSDFYITEGIFTKLGNKAKLTIWCS